METVCKCVQFHPMYCIDQPLVYFLGFTFPNSCIPITAKMKMMMQRTKVRLDRAPTVFIMMVRISLRDFQDLANLNTLDSFIH